MKQKTKKTGNNPKPSIRFEASDCASPCIIVDQFICINTQVVKLINSTLLIKDSSGGLLKSLESIVQIVPNDTGNCLQPDAKCTTPPRSR